MIKCDSCGKCCTLLHHFDFMDEYHDGSGVCKHLTEDNKCEIYDNRPDVCNSRTMFDAVHSNYMTEEEYIQASELICIQLKEID